MENTESSEYPISGRMVIVHVIATEGQSSQLGSLRITGFVIIGERYSLVPRLSARTQTRNFQAESLGDLDTCAAVCQTACAVWQTPRLLDSRMQDGVCQTAVCQTAVWKMASGRPHLADRRLADSCLAGAASGRRCLPDSPSARRRLPGAVSARCDLPDAIFQTAV